MCEFDKREQYKRRRQHFPLSIPRQMLFEHLYLIKKIVYTNHADKAKEPNTKDEQK